MLVSGRVKPPINWCNLQRGQLCEVGQLVRQRVGFLWPKWVRNVAVFFIGKREFSPWAVLGGVHIPWKKIHQDFVNKKRSVCFILIRPTRRFQTEVRTKVCFFPQIPCQAALFRKMETGEVRVLPVRWCRIISSYWSWCGGFQVF